MPDPHWLPPITHVRDGWRYTPIWELGGDGAVCVGATVLADPGQPLTPEALGPLWELVAAGPDRRALAAAVYRRALDAGGAPTKAVAEALGMTVASAYNLVVKLRRDELLPRTTPGKAAA